MANEDTKVIEGEVTGNITFLGGENKAFDEYASILDLNEKDEAVKKNPLSIFSVGKLLDFAWNEVSAATQEDEVMDFDVAAGAMRAYKTHLDKYHKAESDEFKTLMLLLYLNKLSAWIGFCIYDYLKDDGVVLELTNEGQDIYDTRLSQAMSMETQESIAIVNIFKIEDVDCEVYSKNMEKILDAILYALNSERVLNSYFYDGVLKKAYVFYDGKDIVDEPPLDEDEISILYRKNKRILGQVLMLDRENSLHGLTQLKLTMEAGNYLIKVQKRNELIKRLETIKIRHLDKGYVKLINLMGDDSFAARFARSSYDKTDIISLAKDRNLVNRLVRDRHTSPLEACQIAFEIKTCMMVRDQHVRHRMSSINIQSNRYTKHDGEYYVPRTTRIKRQSKTNKQGSGETIREEIAENIISDLMVKPLDDAYAKYQTMLAYGVTRELARGILGSAFYSKISWTIDTHNLMHYLKLRNSEEAQEEIRELAQIVELYFELLFPDMYDSYSENIKEAITFSRTEASVLKDMLNYFVINNTEEKDKKVINAILKKLKI